MCEICRKYRCPDGCPNNYTPRGKRRKGTLSVRSPRFKVILEIGADSARNIERIRENNNEIISKD
ncbi:MAG: hypothetical protein IJ011_10775 [Clostridia bacterium]|nr:hypothetical protein [Clostridia bacterium]MBQ8850806.1 hypothetical protein [Clostridia bacterium]